MSRFRGHEGCPSCGSRDNLARYDDGGAFCFGCHYKERPTHAPMRRMGDTTEDDKRHSRPIPEDIGHDFSQQCIEWLGRYYVDVPTAIRNELYWSPRNEQLIYKLGNCWQARNFGGFWLDKFGKCFTSGDVNECTHIYGTHQAESMGRTGESDRIRRPDVPSTLVVVEDPVSALRIGPLRDAMPLLGSHLAQARLNALAKLYTSIVFWLDSDKYKEARAMEQRAKYMGLSARTIYTDEDPKCYTNDKLREILNFDNRNY